MKSIVKEYGREGNECYLLDRVELINDDGDIILRRTHKANGSWFEPVYWTGSGIIHRMTACRILEEVNEYLRRELLEDSITFTLEEIQIGLDVL